MTRSLRLQLSITSVAPGGDGVAHVDIDGQRRAVFVPQASPGDVLRAEVDPSTRPARGRLLELVTPGPDRVAPPCAWSTRCGGCDWMHLSPSAQQRAHLEHVREALPIAWKDVPMASHTAGSALFYRNRARIHVRSDRRGVDVGMHEARTHDPIAVDTCAVLDPAVEGARKHLAKLFENGHGHGDVQIALGVRRIPVIEVHWTGDLENAFFGRVEKAVATGSLAGARITLGDASRPAVIGDPTPWITGADGQPLRLASGGFAQASESANVTLARHVAKEATAGGVHHAVELYAGAGNLTVMLAPSIPRLTTVERNRDSCDAARANLLARSLTARVVEADADDHAFAPAVQLVVLDPPRTGARRVAERLASSRVARIVYVSCDPPTLGRDLRILSEVYEPSSVTLIEMFPQTSHVETVVTLVRARANGHGRKRNA